MDYQLLTVKDVASILTIGTRSVLDLIRDGELAAVKVNARTYRITPEALGDFLAKNSTAHQPPPALRGRNLRAEYDEQSADEYLDDLNAGGEPV